jgi:uncharacterized protein YidB (DUF937 family)
MNPMDAFKGGVAGIAEKFGGDTKLFPEVMKLVQNMPGGVSGLLKQVQDKGLGHVVGALTGKAPEQKITPEQIVQGFGTEKIQALATSTGMDQKILPERLAAILPKIVGQLAPLAKADSFK